MGTRGIYKDIQVLCKYNVHTEKSQVLDGNFFQTSTPLLLLPFKPRW